VTYRREVVSGGRREVEVVALERWRREVEVALR